MRKCKAYPTDLDRTKTVEGVASWDDGLLTDVKRIHDERTGREDATMHSYRRIVRREMRKRGLL